MENVGCANLACSVVTYKASDPKAETFSGGDGRTYPMATPGEGLYDLPILKKLRDGFDKDVREDMKRWDDPGTQGCCEDCYCVASKEAKDIVKSSVRYPFSTPVLDPDGTSTVVNGSYQLDIERAAGTCIPLPEAIRALIALLKLRSGRHHEEKPQIK